MIDNILNASIFEQLTFLLVFLILLLVLKAVLIKNKPDNTDFINSIVICVSIYSCWAIGKVVSMQEESSDIVIPIFLALAMQLWMTFNAITDYLKNDSSNK